MFDKNDTHIRKQEENIEIPKENTWNTKECNGVLTTNGNENNPWITQHCRRK